MISKYTKSQERKCFTVFKKDAEGKIEDFFRQNSNIGLQGEHVFFEENKKEIYQLIRMKTMLFQMFGRTAMRKEMFELY